MDNNDKERREYFRIKDLAMVSLVATTEQQTLNEIKDQHSAFLLGSAINALDLENQTVFNSIKRNSPDIAQYFEAINKKFELISNHLLESAEKDNALEEINIDLSGSGIAIQTNKNHSEGDRVIIKLLLLPERKGIICIGRIARVKSNNNQNTLCIDFDNIEDSDRELIVKHTISIQLKEARRNNDLYD